MRPREELEAECVKWSDAYVLEQIAAGPATQLSTVAIELLRREAARRSLDPDAPIAPHVASSEAVPVSLLSRLWRGHVPLWQTYWLWGVLGQFLLAGTGVLVAGIPGLGLILSFFAMCYSVFATVAIWRSTERYPGPSYWGGIARASIVLSVVRVLVDLLGLDRL